jgi:predicted PurR-regulated permease PerM
MTHPMPVPAPSPIKDPRRRVWILGGLWFFALAVLIVFHRVVLPFAAAAIIAFLLAPLVSGLSKVRIRSRQLPRWLAILLIYAAFFVVVYVGIVSVVPQIYKELAKISRDAVGWSQTLTPEKVHDYAVRFEDWLDARGIPVNIARRSLEGGEAGTDGQQRMSLSFDLEQEARGAADKLSRYLGQNVGNIVAISRTVIATVIEGVFMTFLILMVAAFLSSDAAGIRRYLTTLIPPEYGEDISILVKMMDVRLAGVVRGQFIICLVNGLLTLAGLFVFGVKFAFLLASIATLFSLIPVFGTILSSIPIVLLALTQSWKAGLGMLLWIIGIHALEAYVLNPKILGRSAQIHPVIVAFVLIAGERTWGIAGLLFAVPVAALTTAGFDFFRLKAQPPVSYPQSP